MLKQFLKTVLIALISSTLVTSPVMATEDSRPVVTTEKDGTKSAKATYNFQGVKDNDMIASITMLAAGALAARMAVVYNKPLPTDVMIAAAGGAMFIAGEVMSNMKFKGEMEAKTAEVILKKGSVPNQEQIEYLQKLKQTYEEAKKATQTKKTLQTAAAAAMGLAALWAGVEAMQEDAADALCYGALQAAKPVLSKCIAAGTAAAATGVAAKEAAVCTTCLAEVSMYEALFTKNDVEGAIPGPSAMKEKVAALNDKTLKSGACKSAAAGVTATNVALAVNAKCMSATNFKMALSTSTENPKVNAYNLNKLLFPAPLISYEQFQSKDISFFENALNAIVPSAQASWNPLLGLSAAALTAYFAISGPLAVQIDSYMFVARNRAIAYAGLGLLAMAAASSSDGVLKQLDKNIEKIDRILKELMNLQKAVALKNVKEEGISLQTVDPNLELVGSFSSDGKTKSQCMTSSSSSNCQSLEEQLKAVPGFSQMPAALQTLANQTTRTADGLSGSTGISSATMNGASSLAGKNNAIRNLLKKTQQRYNAQLKKNGKGETDFDKEGAKFIKGMAATVKKSLQKQGLTPAGFLASYGGRPIDSSSLDKKMELAEEAKADPSVGAATETAPVAAQDANGLDLNFEESEGAFAAASAPAEEAEYDIKTDEIHKDTGPSIFELISSRYLKSGYPKLLEEEPAKN